MKFEDGAFGSRNRIVRELYQKCFNNYNVKTIFIRGIRKKMIENIKINVTMNVTFKMYYVTIHLL